MTQIIRKQSSMQKVLGFWVCLYNNSLHLSEQQQQQQELHIRRLAWPGNCNSFQLTAWQVGRTTRQRCNTTRLQDARLLPQDWLHDSLYCRCCCSSSCCKPAQPCHIPGGATTRPTTMPVWIQWSGHVPLLRIRWGDRALAGTIIIMHRSWRSLHSVDDNPSRTDTIVVVVPNAHVISKLATTTRRTTTTTTGNIYAGVASCCCKRDAKRGSYTGLY